MSAPADPKSLGPLLCACPRCRRQWDATGLETGAELRCTCGELFLAAVAAARSPRVFRCAQCGAALPAEGRACGYCQAEITLEERGLSGVCPGCSARLSADARFCMECGLAIQVQRLSALRASVDCPRCHGALRVREIGAQSAIECSSCAGLWLAQGFFEELTRRAEGQDLPSGLFHAPGTPAAPGGTSSGSASGSAASATTLGYIACLTCGELMLRRNFGGSSGIVVDACKHHGVWLDHRELERALEFVRQGGLVRARQRELGRLAREAERRSPSEPARGGTFFPERGDAWEREHDLLDLLAGLGAGLARWLR